MYRILLLILLFIPCVSYAATPLISCNNTNQALQSNQTNQTYSCFTVGSSPFASLTAGTITATGSLVANQPTGSGGIVLFGGTYSGTIDNIVIGTSTPSAATFTTLKANTSITGPNGAAVNIQNIGFVFGVTPGFAIPAGKSPARVFSAGGVIKAVYIAGGLSGGSCSAVVDIWMLQSGYPTVSNTITASDLPTLSSANYHKDSTLSGWTTTVPTDAVFMANIQSTTCDTLTVTLEIAQ